MRITIQQLTQFKQSKKSIIALTAWDYSLAQVLDAAGVDIILVGDSLAMVGLGYSSTLPVTLDEMIHHAKAVCRGVKQALVVCDLPFMSYQTSVAQAMDAAGRVLKETESAAIKIEGGNPRAIKTVAELTAIGVPVMAHVGLTPQSFRILGYKQQGKTANEANLILDQAIALAQAGAFAVVLEHIPSDLAATITAKISIPTIGIGAGNQCDGQVLVTADFLGLSARKPPFAKSYVNLREVITQAVNDFKAEVQEHKFPTS